MLTLQNVTIHINNFGTVLGIFLVSDSKQGIINRYYSFYNHETTNGELEWWSETCAMFWVYSDKKGTARDKVRRGLIRGAEAELEDLHPDSDVAMQAQTLGQLRFEQIENVNWITFDKKRNLADVTYLREYSLGNTSASKPVGDFSDVLSAVVNRGASALDAVRLHKVAEMTDGKTFMEQSWKNLHYDKELSRK